MNGLINRQTNRGSTPLHHAATSGYSDVAEWLFENGARDSLAIADAGGRKPCDHIRQRLDKLEERSDKDAVEMARIKEETDLWKALLDKLEAQLEATPALPTDALKV